VFKYPRSLLDLKYFEPAYLLSNGVVAFQSPPRQVLQALLVSYCFLIGSPGLLVRYLRFDVTVIVRTCSEKGCLNYSDSLMVIEMIIVVTSYSGVGWSNVTRGKEEL